MFLWPTRSKSYLWDFFSLATSGGEVWFGGGEVELGAGWTAVQEEVTLDAPTCREPKKNAVPIATHAHNRGMEMIIATRLVVHNWTNGHPHRSAGVEVSRGPDCNREFWATELEQLSTGRQHASLTTGNEPTRWCMWKTCSKSKEAERSGLHG